MISPRGFQVPCGLLFLPSRVIFRYYLRKLFPYRKSVLHFGLGLFQYRKKRLTYDSSNRIYFIFKVKILEILILLRLNVYLLTINYTL